MSKKKIFAIIIFIVFGLFMFSFANPIEIDNPYGQVEVDKTKLKDAIDRGTALIEKHGTGSDVLKELDEAVKDGKDVYDDESTQDEVDDATKRIEDAIKNLEDDIMNRANISLYPNTLAPSTFVNLITTVTIDDNQYIDSVKFVVGTNCYANGTNLVLDANNQAVTRVTANSTYTSCLFLTNGTVKQASQTIGNINAEVPDTEAPVISLNGKELIKIVLGKTTYEDELARVIDNVDPEREIAGELVGKVDEIGSYELRYNAKDSAGNEATEVVRTIKVLDPKGDEDNDGFTNEEEIDAKTDLDDPESHPETEAPTITLKGKNPYIMLQNRKYVEAGVEITLDVHDTITTIDDVVVKGSVDTTKVGVYTITYTITDRYGKTASVERTVKVLDPNGDEDNDGFTNEEEIEKPLEPINPDEPKGENNPLVETDPTDPEDDNSHPETYAPSITLNGEDLLCLEVHSEYIEKGVSIVLDPHDTITTIDDVVVTGSVDTDTLGEYILTYTITDRYGKTASVTRTIDVIDSQAPVINLNGNSTITLERESEYVELGASVTDNYDKDLVAIITGSVDTNTLGTYYIRYNATDSSGNKATEVVRTVIVVRSENDKKVASISAVLNPTTYDRGTNTYGDLTVTATDNDGTTHVLNTSEYTVTGWDSSLEVGSESASRKLTIVLNSDNTISTTVDYEIVRSESDKQLNRIEATLEKTEYKRGEEIETLRVTAYDNDGTSYDVTNEASHDFDSTTVGDKTLLVGYKGKTDTVDYRVVRNDEDKKVASISAVLNPTTYDRGTNTYGDLTVTATDNDGTTHVLNTSEYTVTGWDSSLEVGSESASRKLTIVLNSDNTISTTVDYEIVRSESDKQLNRIEATLEKTEYKRGEEIETLRVTAYDNDGTSYDVTNEASHDFDSTTVGDKTLTVTYEGKSDTVDYRVVRNDEDKQIKELTAELEKDVYKRGEAMSNIVVTRIDNDGTRIILDSTQYTLTGFSTEVVGTFTVTVTHDNLTATDTYTVERNDEDKQIKELTAELEKDVYKRGEAMSNIVVTRIDNDGTRIILDSTQYTLTGFSTEVVGTFTVTVTHDNLTATDTYTVGDIEIDIKTPALTVSGKNAEPGQIVDYEISLSTDMPEVSLPTYTIEIGEGMVLESCPANATCNGNTITWTPTSVDEKLNYSAKVGNNVPAGSVIKTTVKENNKVVKEFDTNIEVTVEVSTSQTTATSLEVVLTLDVSGSMWECSKSSWFTCESTKIEDLISVTKQFVTDLNNKNTNGSTINLTIITFGRRKDNACFNNGTCYETLYTGGLTSTTLTGINNAIDTIDDNGENRGGTHLYGALNSALNIINNSTLNNKYLVVLGDGEPTDEDNYNVINNLKTTTANVFSIGFKVSSGSKAERVLKSVVNNNDSHYFSADNSSSLEESFNTIQESIDTQAVQTVNGNIEANALNAKSIEISHSGMTKVTITDLSEINLSNYNISIVEGKFVWNVSKYPGNTNYKMIVNY